MAKKQPKPTEIDPAEAEIRAQLLQITEQRERGMLGFDKDTAMAAAALGRALVAFQSERRQQAKVDQRQLDSFPIAALVERLKGLPEEDRDRIRRELGGEDEGSLL